MCIHKSTYTLKKQSLPHTPCGVLESLLRDGTWVTLGPYAAIIWMSMYVCVRVSHQLPSAIALLRLHVRYYVVLMLTEKPMLTFASLLDLGLKVMGKWS